jgi:arylformamidase
MTPLAFDASAPLAEREREYSPSSCIGGDYRPFVAAYRERSAAARRATLARGARWQRHAYGPGPAQGIELCLPPQQEANATALLLFVHGGYWQELSAADSLFAAEACVARGFAFAALDYTLAPAATVATIAEECSRAFSWLVAHAAGLGLDARRIVIAGSSAGAHLAAMTALAAAGSAGAVAPHAMVLVSGIYWLEPLIGTSIDQALQLSPASARAASPGLMPVTTLAAAPPALLCWGEVETAAFKQQGRAFAAHLRAAGARCEDFEAPGRNHFDVILDLADGSTPLGTRVMALLGSPAAAA